MAQPDGPPFGLKQDLSDGAGPAGYGEVFVEPKGPEDGQVRKAPLVTAPPAQRSSLAWPWGLVAIGIMALAWVGIYLLWNGLVFLFNW